MPRTAYSGVRSSWARPWRKRAFALAVARRSAACSCSSATSAVTPRLASDSSASRTRSDDEGRGQLGVLLAQLLQARVGPTGLVVLQRAQDERELVVVGDPGVGVEVAGQADPVVADLDTIDELLERGAVHQAVPGTAHRHHDDRRLGVGDGEVGLGAGVLALRHAADLPDRGGQPALGLCAELQQAREVTRAAAGEEHVLDRSEGQRDHGRGHGRPTLTVRCQLSSDRWSDDQPVFRPVG